MWEPAAVAAAHPADAPPRAVLRGVCERRIAVLEFDANGRVFILYYIML